MAVKSSGGQYNPSLSDYHVWQGTQMTAIVQGVGVPDSKLARAITELVRDTESPLLFHHSSRVYYWGALAAAE